MGNRIERSSNFFMDLFVKQEIPEIYSKIRYFGDSYDLGRPNNPFSSSQSQKSYSVALIPEYFELELIDSEKFRAKTYNQNNLGYAVRLTDEFTIDSYLKEQLKSNARHVKKRHKRLEDCYEISYKFFYGEITEDEYQYVMQCLRAMLVRRFSQRKDINEKLLEWDELIATTKKQIDEKKASLFVIYDNEVPIDVSLNYHYQDIMFSAVSSYDIDYHKFGLGAIEKIKLLEWCMEHQYKLLDLGYGDLDYKASWSNYGYRFKYQVVFNKKSIPAWLFAFFELNKLSIKEYLKSKKIDVYVKNIKTWHPFKKGNESIDDYLAYEKIQVDDLDCFKNIRKVDYNHESSFPMKLVINEFIYTTLENKDSVEVFEILSEPNAFLIKGKSNAQKVTFLK